MDKLIRNLNHKAQVFSSAIVLFIILILVGLVFALNSFKQMLLISSVAGLCVGLAILGLFVGMQNFGFIGLVGARWFSWIIY